jgi:hypothetical protein
VDLDEALSVIKKSDFLSMPALSATTATWSAAMTPMALSDALATVAIYAVTPVTVLANNGREISSYIDATNKSLL